MDILLVLIVILIVVLIWRGPSMLPQFGEALGKAVRGARDTMDRDADSTAADSTAAEATDAEKTAPENAAKADDDGTSNQ